MKRFFLKLIITPMFYKSFIKKSKFGFRNIIGILIFLSGSLLFDSIYAESLSNITETGKDFYLQKNIDSVNRIIQITKILGSIIWNWYQTNNSQIIAIKYFKLGQLDILCGLLLIILIIYFHKSKKSLGRVK